MAIRRRSKVEQAKIILLGDAFGEYTPVHVLLILKLFVLNCRVYLVIVGKTSILRRYTDDSFISNGVSYTTLSTYV